MIFFDRFLVTFFMNIEIFFSRKYIIGENRFTRLRKMSFEDYIKYVYIQRGNTNFSEAIRFYRGFLKKDFESITRQAIGKQRKYILPDLYKDIFLCFVDNLYDKFKGFSKINGYIVAAGDTSVCDLPSDRKLKEKMGVKKNLKSGHENSRARISCFLDVYSKIIISAVIVQKRVSEVQLAIDHLIELTERMDVTKLITTFDRGYAALELMVVMACLNSKFLIRLKSTTFQNKIKKLETNDGIITLNIKKRTLNKIRDKKIRKQAKKMGRINIRIVKVELKIGEIEILATNLSPVEFSSQELKGLYKKRWEIETGFDRLKNYVRIEDFSGRSIELIEQDFYANVFLYNVAMCIKMDATKRIMRQPRKSKHKYVYVVNFSQIISLLYENFFDLISEIRVMKEYIIDFIVREAARDPTNKKIDVERKRGSLLDPNNDHNGYKKNPIV